MKNLILVTRVTSDINSIEFPLYTDNKENCAIVIETPEIYFMIVDGKLLDGNVEEKPCKLQKIIESECINKEFETIIAYHDDDTWSQLIRNKMTDIKISQIEKYSTRGDESTSPVYKNYLIDLRALIKDNSNNITRRNELIIGLYNFFLGDPELEAKLNLLHQCLTPAGAKEARSITNYDLIKNLVDNVKIKFNEGEEKDIIDYLSTQTDCFDEDNYIKPLSKLRDALLRE